MGRGSPLVAQVNSSVSLSCRMTGLRPPTPLLLMAGGIKSLSSAEHEPFTAQAHT